MRTHRKERSEVSMKSCTRKKISIMLNEKSCHSHRSERSTINVSPKKNPTIFIRSSNEMHKIALYYMNGF